MNNARSIQTLHLEPFNILYNGFPIQTLYQETSH